MVAVALVVGIDDETWGTKVAAVVIVDDALMDKELNMFCQNHGPLSNDHGSTRSSATERRSL